VLPIQKTVLSSDAALFRQQASTVLSSMREELDDHRLAINENTDELGSMNEFLNEVNKKVDKLAERLDELTLLIKGTRPEQEFSILPLSEREKEVFYALYVSTETTPFVTYEELAKKALMTRETTSQCVTAMMQKGIPVVKKYDGTRVFMRLDEKFRQVQAKKNLVGLSARLNCWLR